MRIGILTAGGDCPGLNAAIRAVAKRLILHHGAEVIGFEDGYLGLIERRSRKLGYRDASGILLLGGTILGTDNKCDPFRFGDRGADVSDQVVRCFGDYRLDGLVVIGGDGSMSIAHRLNQKGIPIVGVPKTIDNDLVGTERTIGFDTAVAIATDAIDRIHTTSQSHHRVFVVETMGRYAGWIALHSGIAGGADVILIPEIEFELEEIAAVCQERQSGAPRFTIVVAAEGARAVGGDLVVREQIASSADPLRLGGIADRIADGLKTRVRSEVRAISLGHVQRGGTPTPTDRVLATSLGSYAAVQVASGNFGRMAAIQENRLTTVPLESVAEKTRNVPLESPLLLAARGVGVSLGARRPSREPAGTEQAGAAT